MADRHESCGRPDDEIFIRHMLQISARWTLSLCTLDAVPVYHGSLLAEPAAVVVKATSCFLLRWHDPLLNIAHTVTRRIRALTNMFMH